MSRITAPPVWNVPAGAGPTFLRLHVVDMKGLMDQQFGIFVPEPTSGHERIRPDVMPAGDYATLVYRNHTYQANVALQRWIRENGVSLDQRPTPSGDVFGGRYAAYLTDPNVEPRKTRWAIELAPHIADRTG